jgi:hypothetical protein
MVVVLVVVAVAVQGREGRKGVRTRRIQTFGWCQGSTWDAKKYARRTRTTPLPTLMRPVFHPSTTTTTTVRCTACRYRIGRASCQKECRRRAHANAWENGKEGRGFGRVWLRVAQAQKTPNQTTAPTTTSRIHTSPSMGSKAVILILGVSRIFLRARQEEASAMQTRIRVASYCQEGRVLEAHSHWGFLKSLSAIREAERGEKEREWQRRF